MLILFCLILIIVLFLVIAAPSEKYENKADIYRLGDYRLGNVIDAWYFGSLGSKERVRLFREMTEKRQRSWDKMFLNSLKLGEGITLTDPDRIKILNKASDKFWASYSYNNIKLALPEMGNDIFKKMKEFSPKLINQLYTSNNHVVVHYRIGDFLNFGEIISPRSIVDAISSFGITPTTIEILDGGTRHNTDDTTQEISKKIKSRLIKLLNQRFPNVQVLLAPNRTPDEDFYRMVMAPNLVTGAGSFAILAAITNVKGNIRTPNSVNLNFLSKGMHDFPLQIKDNWITYQYDNLKVEDI